MKYLLLFTLFYTILTGVETTTGYKPVFNPNALTTPPAHFTLSAVIDHLQTLTSITLPQTAESRAYGKGHKDLSEYYGPLLNVVNRELGSFTLQSDTVTQLIDNQYILKYQSGVKPGTFFGSDEQSIINI